MGQSGYAETFTNIMLGWIRNLAGSVASMFQTTSGDASGGLAILNWFAKNWLGLLITLIVLGILIDWVVWLIRWRPHWLWFQKRRIILDDDIDEQLTERELNRRYDPDQAVPPYFMSDADEHDEDAYGYDEYDEDAYDDEFDDEEYDDDDQYEDDGTQADDGDYEEDDWDAPYEEPPTDSTDDAWMNFDDEWADAPTPAREKKRPSLFARRRKEDEDPFAVDEDAYRDTDDGFYKVVSEAPLYTSDSILEALAEPSTHSFKLVPLPDRVDDGDYDERIGYSSSFEPKAGTALSRKSRRKTQEG